PSNERFRFDHGKEWTPINQARQRDERQPDRVVGSPRLDPPLEAQRQLLAEKQILGGELPPWLQHRQCELQHVACDAHDGADIEARTGLRHETGCYADARPRRSRSGDRAIRAGSEPDWSFRIRSNSVGMDFLRTTG